MAQLTFKYLAIYTTNTVADWWQVVVREYPKDILGYRGALQISSWLLQIFFSYHLPIKVLSIKKWNFKVPF
jgi:hypothetical protein